MSKAVQISAATFATSGYLVVRGFRDAAYCKAVREEVRAQLQPVIAPAEFEADVGYPGAPENRQSEGGMTSRRLLGAIARFPHLRDFAVANDVAAQLRSLLPGAAEPVLSQCHHNCVMTKYPGYSSATLWHQDVRYWSFDQPELVSAWLALGDESTANGALRVIPGSHLTDLDRGRLDADLFLRPDLEENKALIRRAVVVELEQGDALFFHSKLFHAAGKNRTKDVKLSAVFTYHDASNQPIPGTRSAQYPGIALEVVDQ